MQIGVPREIKVHEYRVGLTSESVRELVHHGHITHAAVAQALGLAGMSAQQALTMPD